ncbi:LuxR family transcriptional regulator [Streptomyces sp. DSM 118878]
MSTVETGMPAHAEKSDDRNDTGTREDEIERALLEVHALIEDTVAKYRNQESTQPLVTSVEPDEGTVLAQAEKMIGQAKRWVDVVLATDAARSRRMDGLLRGLAEARGDEVEIRVLRTRATFGREAARDYRAMTGNFDVRIARSPVLDSVVVDGNVALVFADSAIGPRASVTGATGVIRILRTLFTGVWRNAVSVTDRIDFGDRTRTEFARRILGCLHAGVTDEVAARELSVSVRTYRRYVAEIMELVGANSRFQAGVYAAELGLLPALADRCPDRGP